MGSIAIHDVAPHFPASMFDGSGGHIQPPHHHSSSALRQQQHSSPNPQDPERAASNAAQLAGGHDRMNSGGFDNGAGPNTQTMAGVQSEAPLEDVSMVDAGSSRVRGDSNPRVQQPAVETALQGQPPNDIVTSTHTSRSVSGSSMAHGFRSAPADAGELPPIHVQQGQHQNTPPSARSRASSSATPPNKIKVMSLSHIQSFATDEHSPFSQTRSSSRRARRDAGDAGPQYEISEMPVGDIIEMVAGLLTKITSTNDRQHEHLHRNIPMSGERGGPTTANMSQQASSVLAFHGKNVPSISILSYLGRINKYCPTTYEVFLSLLVYFDRMTERVNAGPMRNLRRASQQNLRSDRAASESIQSPTVQTGSNGPAPNRTPVQPEAQIQQGTPTPPPSGSLEKTSEDTAAIHRDHLSPLRTHVPGPDSGMDVNQYNLSQFFVVDSFNIHRLVIAGVTCASKFFSDIFYTNSRYAKVGGLPLVELNHLELQFLILNDFRLSVPLEEMEAYGTMLVEFYAREVVAQQLHS